MTKRALAVAACLAAFAAASPPPAHAFCGFYVGGAETKLFNNATHVVLLRHGQRTVLSMANNYQGPPERFAMVVPVPVVLKKEDVKTLTREVLERIDKLSAPRLVEYWEQDPCAVSIDDDVDKAGATNQAGAGKQFKASDEAKDLGVTVEAQFTVGEYDIVILSAKDAAGLETWLKQETYAIPEGAEPYFRPYVQSGSKFFVAKVDPGKVKFEKGMAQLSPLRFHYDTPELSLPIRLGLINSSGTQDLVINVLAKNQRFEPANYPSVTIPTNLDLAEAGRDRFGSFYAALFDRTIEKNPKAIVTEYAWDASTCDPCPGPALSGADISVLGGDVIADAGSRIAQVRVQDAHGSIARESVLRNITRVVTSRTRTCHDMRFKQNVELGGRVDVKLTFAENGAVDKVDIVTNETKDKELADCIVQGMKTSTFLGAEPKGIATVPLTLSIASNVTPFGWTVTRLHARYGKDAGQDITFKAAPAIAGGREVQMGGALEHASSPAPANNFQARYAIRHAWTGAIACAKPRRGIWRGPPAAVAIKSSKPTPATNLAFVDRTGVDLPNLVRTDAPEIELKSNVGPVLPVIPAASASAAPATTLGTEKKGCAGCTTGARDGESAALAAALAVAVGGVYARRRRRSPERQP